LSEFLRPQQRRQEIPQQQNAHDHQQDLTQHFTYPYLNRWQARMYKIETPKKTTVAAKKVTSAT
jgi:hypothetical protein